jgi:hypothetical protein
MKQNKSSNAKGKVGPATPKRKLELRRRTLRTLTTEQLLTPAGGVTGINSICQSCHVTCY